MRTINLGIVAHVDAGKTTLTEAMLYNAGALRHFGRVDHGDTTADYLQVERERGITVRASTVSFEYNNTKVNILDTPGHMDFIAEVERSLTVLDAAVLVLSAKEGVQSQTRVLWQALSALRIPTLIFINKLDRLGADAYAVLAQIRAQLTGAALLRQRIDGVGVATLPLDACDDVNDRLFEADDAYAQAYLDGANVDPAARYDAYLRGVACGRIYPVYAGVALDGVGVIELMDALTAELPCADASQTCDSALVYKLEFHPKLGGIVYARVYGGGVAVRRTINVYGAQHTFRVTNLFTPQCGQLRGTGYVPCGDIAVLPVREQIAVGSVLGDAPPPVQVATFAEPMLLVRVTSDDTVPRDTLLTVIKQLCMEDPLLGFGVNEQTNALELRVFGRVQIEILTQLALDRYGIHLYLTEPQTIFREKPAAAATGVAPWRVAGLPATVTLEIEPLPEGAGVIYESAVSYGYLQTPFQNAVREGVMGMVKHGLYGWELTDLRVTLTDAFYSSVDSTPSDFRRTVPVAVIHALTQCDTDLLEPMLHYTLSIPADKAGRATYDLGVMRATMDEMCADEDALTVSGTVPLHTSKDYAQEVAAYTKGLGVFAVRGAGYARYDGDKAAVANRGYELPSVEKYLLQLAGRL